MDTSGKARPATNAVKASKPRPTGEPHCDTCCPWYPEPCSSDFSPEFGSEMQGNCLHSSCIEADHEIGSKLKHAEKYPWDCLPWKADVSCCDGWFDHSLELRGKALTLAWATMKALTGGRIANGCTILRPCLRNDTCDICTDGTFSLDPQLIDGKWVNWPCLRDNDCSCCDICEIKMPGRVAALLEVNIDGYRHDPRLFRIDNGNNLVRQDGCCFPGCQNLGAPYGYYGTLGIRYVPGVVPNAAGSVGGRCVGVRVRQGVLRRQVPPAASRHVDRRQGVTMEFPSGMFDTGTGIREVDAYVHSVNPNRLTVPPQVYSPDIDSRTSIGSRPAGPSGVWP